jgi:hypothetical protein
MKNLTVRLLATLVAIAALGAGGYQAWQLEKENRAGEQARAQVADRIHNLTIAVAETRAQQEAYVAAGQGSAFWAAKVAQALARFDNEVGELKPLLATAEARSAIDAAVNSIETFRKMDVRAREYARNGQELLASDLIFADGFEMTAAALNQLETARAAEGASGDSSSQAIRRSQLQVIGAGVGVCVIMLIALTPRATPRAATDLEFETTRIAPSPAPKPAEPRGEPRPVAESKKSAEPDLAAAAKQIHEAVAAQRRSRKGTAREGGQT